MQRLMILVLMGMVSWTAQGMVPAGGDSDHGFHDWISDYLSETERRQANWREILQSRIQRKLENGWTGTLTDRAANHVLHVFMNTPTRDPPTGSASSSTNVTMTVERECDVVFERLAAQGQLIAECRFMIQGDIHQTRSPPVPWTDRVQSWASWHREDDERRAQRARTEMPEARDNELHQEGEGREETGEKRESDGKDSESKRQKIEATFAD